MNTNVLLKRIAALILTAVMTLSMSGFAFEEVFADSAAGTDEALTSEYADAALDAAGPDALSDITDSAEDSASEEAGDESAAPAGNEAAQEAETPKEQEPEAAEEQAEDNSTDSDADGEIESISSDSLNAGGNLSTKGVLDPSDLDPITGFEVIKFTAGADGKINAAVKWDAYRNAAGYKIGISGSDEASADSTEYTLTGLSKGQRYIVIVKAVDKVGAPIASGNFELYTYVTGFTYAGSQEEFGYIAGQVKYNNKIKLSWTAFPGADSYTVTKTMTASDGSEIKDVQRKEGQLTIDVKTSDALSDNGTCEATFENLHPGRKYTFTVTAKAGDTALAETLPNTVKNVQPRLGKLTPRARGGKTVSPNKIKFANGSTDLRAYAGQKRNGWGVAQGGTSDGVNAYVLLANSYKQTGRIAKYRMSDNSIVKVSETLQTTHGNGMAYDARRHQLAVIGRNDSVRGNHKQEITIIDADDLKIVRQQNLKYTYYANDTEYFDADQRSRGLAAIAYSPKYDVYVAKQRDLNNLIIIDPDTLKAIGLIKTLVNQYGGAGQAMDGDDQFVYMLKSDISKDTHILLTLDWNSGQLIDTTTGYRREYVPEYWGCTNNLYPVATYTIKSPHEAENVFHFYDNMGREIFYMTEYDPDQQYNITKTQKAYKAKWKKVKKKVKVKKTKKVKKKVKWKKVKTKKGKYKWKYKKKKVKVTYYKWKKKKVWLYKTKYKTVTTKTPTYKDRKDYVYYLGIL